MTSVRPGDKPSVDIMEPATRVAEVERRTWRGRPWLPLWCVFIGALFAWLLVEAVHPAFANKDAEDEYGFLPADVQWEVDRNNAVLVLALLGAFAGAGLAVGEAPRRRSWGAALLGGSGISIAGALSGSLAGYLGLATFHYFRSNAEMSDLSKAILFNAAVFTTLGCGIGLGAGLFLGRSFRAATRYLLAGLWSGILASIAYPVIVALLMPSAITTVLIPTEARERLLWFGIGAILLGTIIPSVSRIREPMNAPVERKQRELAGQN